VVIKAGDGLRGERRLGERGLLLELGKEKEGRPKRFPFLGERDGTGAASQGGAWASLSRQKKKIAGAVSKARLKKKLSSKKNGSPT